MHAFFYTQPAQIRASAIGPRGFQVELESLHPHYNDIVIVIVIVIVIDTDSCNTLESRSALIAARLVIVPVQTDQVDLATQYKLISRLKSARMFNPGLRVLFVIVAGSSDPSDQERAAIRTYVAQVMSATLAGTLIHVRRAAESSGAPASDACEHEHADARAQEDMSALYHEVFVK